MSTGDYSNSELLDDDSSDSDCSERNMKENTGTCHTNTTCCCGCSCSLLVAGRWTSEEHRLFLEGLRLHGKGWKKIAAVIKTRTVVQIRTHAQKYFQKLAKAKQSGFSGEILMDGRSTFTVPAKKRSNKRRVSHLRASSAGTTSNHEQDYAEEEAEDGDDEEADAEQVVPVSSAGLAIDAVAADKVGHIFGSPSPTSVVEMRYSIAPFFIASVS